ncbi:MAG: SulP family inorganic anion transporter, partial [Myxococcota bacterium]
TISPVYFSPIVLSLFTAWRQILNGSNEGAHRTKSRASVAGVDLQPALGPRLQSTQTFMTSFVQRFTGNLRGDLFGGVTAGIVALPLALGFGVASGLENGAAAGLYGAIAIGFFAALFGGTPSQISGPTGPMTVVVAGIVGALTGEIAWVFAMVALSGVFQVVLGVLRLGHYIHYVPYPVVSGFMSGIGAIVIILQLGQLVGHAPASGTMAALAAIPEAFQNINPAALILGLCTIALIYLAPRFISNVPGTLVALLVMTSASVLLGIEVPRIGEIPRGLPIPSMPAWDFAMFQMILIPAAMLAVVGSIDSLLTSLVADSVTKTRHDSERELMGQGIGNIAAGLIGGLPGAGATMRTVVNVRSGGRTHLSGIIHSLLLLAILLSLGPLASQIPMAVLAGILITVGIGIVDAKGLGHIRRAPRGDAAVMLTVLGLTLFVDLMWAVAVGMVMASLILLKRLSDLDPATHSPLIDIAAHRPWMPDLEAPQEVLAGIHVVEIHGSLFFGNAGPLQRKLGSIEAPRAIVLHMGDVRYLDQSGVYALSELINDRQQAGTEIYLAELHEEPRDLLIRLGVAHGIIAEDHIFQRAEEAISAATLGEKRRLAAQKSS